MERIQWFKPHAYKSISNFHGMEIMINDTNEEVSYRYTDEGPDAEVYCEPIQYDQDGDAYFMITEHKQVHYLNGFIKCNWL